MPNLDKLNSIADSLEKLERRMDSLSEAVLSHHKSMDERMQSIAQNIDSIEKKIDDLVDKYQEQLLDQLRMVRLHNQCTW